MDCSSTTDFQQSTAISIAKKIRNLHIGKLPLITKSLFTQQCFPSLDCCFGKYPEQGMTCHVMGPLLKGYHPFFFSMINPLACFIQAQFNGRHFDGFLSSSSLICSFHQRQSWKGKYAWLLIPKKKVLTLSILLVFRIWRDQKSDGLQDTKCILVRRSQVCRPCRSAKDLVS